MNNHSHIVFFDGVCGLCNAFVDFLLSRDKANILKFAPLQGETAKEVLTEELRFKLSTIVFYSEGSIFTHSDAALRSLGALRQPWKTIAFTLLFVPRPIRNFTYRFIAKNRYKLSGRRESCRVPLPSEQRSFLP